MKIRQGFVSNSSSSSFIIYGKSFDRNDFIEMIKSKLSEEDIENIEECECSVTECWNPDTTLEINEDYESEMIYVGRSWSTIGDDETGRQLKENVHQEMEKLFGKKTDCRTMDVTIYG